jgi:hypothetical protein
MTRPRITGEVDNWVRLLVASVKVSVDTPMMIRAPSNSHGLGITAAKHKTDTGYRRRYR